MGDQTNNPTDRKYFFDNGIRFQCQQCGGCCTGEPGTIYVEAGEIIEIAEYIRKPVEILISDFLYPYGSSYSIREHEDGRCFFYDDGCTVYPVRPEQCRTFPFWLSLLRSEENWKHIEQQCPGIGKGRLYTKEEILKKIWIRT